MTVGLAEQLEGFHCSIFGSYCDPGAKCVCYVVAYLPDFKEPAMRANLPLVAIFMFLLSGPVALSDPPNEAEGQGTSTEIAKLRGTWKLQSLVRDGEQIDPGQIDNMRLILSENEYTYKNQQGLRKVGTFKVRPGQRPAILETTYAEEPAEGKTVVRIYQWIDKNTFKLCSPGPDERVPDNFETPKGSGREVGVWKRIDE
jgi:uncharacterized protein (TIGR03067 family)